MNMSQFLEILIFTLPLVIIFAYIVSFRKNQKIYGHEYMAIVSTYQWKFLKGLALLGLYILLSYIQGDWKKVLGGVSFSAGAFTFFSMAIYEMACGISVNHQFNFPKEKAQFAARIFIIGQTISLITLILVFQAASISLVVLVYQVVLLILSIIAFYISGTVINLIKIGYIPISMRNT